MTKLIALSEDPGHVWFGTSGLFDWAADFLLSRVTDPDLREKLRRDAASGYLYLDTVPGPERERLLRALREELPAAVDRDLYPRPLNLREQEPLMAARLKTLTAMAWSHDETEARRSSPLVLLLSQDLRAEVSHGLRSWLLSFLRERSGLPQLAADIGEVDLRDQPSALRALRDDLLPHAAAALDALPPASSRWSRSDLRTLSLLAAAALGT
ncbi:hypothetical protein [Streptacidiphilus monticola]|uniref:Uncharacterized protein n=1 Tax=Streptacidiphilus monticola TaxID=2161674 RepID=A0ABW1G6P2_9ACTN